MKKLGLLTALVLFAIPALAQNNDITLFAGAQFPGSITLRSAPSTGVSGATEILSDPLNAGMFGLRIGHGRVWGGEHTLAFTSKFLDSDSKSFIYNSNLRVQAPLPVVKPYVTAGLGTILSWGSGVSDIGIKFALNYGGGVKVIPAGPVGLNIGVRGYAIPRVQSQTLTLTEVTAGIVIAF
jgi:hypothetical protein